MYPTSINARRNVDASDLSVRFLKKNSNSLEWQKVYVNLHSERESFELQTWKPKFFQRLFVCLRMAIFPLWKRVMQRIGKVLMALQNSVKFVIYLFRWLSIKSWIHSSSKSSKYCQRLLSFQKLQFLYITRWQKRYPWLVSWSFLILVRIFFPKCKKFVPTDYDEKVFRLKNRLHWRQNSDFCEKI